jgi:hypothetical protein
MTTSMAGSWQKVVPILPAETDRSKEVTRLRNVGNIGLLLAIEKLPEYRCDALLI